MARKASESVKRISYVLRNTKGSADVTTSDRDDYEVPSRKKVRKELSVWELKKDSEYFQRDEDHIYSNVKGQKDMRMLEKVKCERLPRVCLTRATALKRSISENHDSVNSDDEINSLHSGKRPRCSSKNALMARLNREKKKQYISSLENTKDRLLKENYEITQKINKQDKMIATLQYEVQYLKSMLANSKEISEILKGLTKSTGLPVSSSLQSLAGEKDDMIVSNDVDAFKENDIKSKIYAEMKRPDIKRVTSGTNFPILQKDVSLGFCDLDDGDQLVNQECEDLDSPISVDGDLHWDNAFLNKYNFDFDFFKFDYPFDSIFSSEFENNNENEPVVNSMFQDVNEFDESDVGLCLHVNKRKISVELCSLCNTRAQIK